jgi:hypothetical protein
VTRTGSSKAASAGFGQSRATIADSYYKSAKDTYDLLDEGDIGNPVASLAVTAAIGFADAICAKLGGEVSTGQHSSAVALLKKALGNEFPRSQETAFTRILQIKDTAQYGAKLITRKETDRVMDDLDKFVEWAREQLQKLAK